ncbi:MAG: class I SAM-dependent RNA methyltransferase [Thermoanaerobaculia bacterium]
MRVQKLAPTGEGVVRGPDGVGFVTGALPGEEVDVEVLETRRSYWRGRALEVHFASADRRPVPPEGCGGCDWPHYDPAAAREAKRELFLETMERIGRLPPSLFGDLPITASPLRYRLRNRFHATGSGATAKIGAFAARSHQVTPVTSCEALTAGTRRAVEGIGDALARMTVPVVEIATLEDREGERRVARVTVADAPAEGRAAALAPLEDASRDHFQSVRIQRPDGRRIRGDGVPRLTLEVEGRVFSVAVDVFFQSNRFAVADLYRDVREASRTVAPGAALDAFGGVGLLAGALLDAGHAVTSVEGDPAAGREASRTRAGWPEAERWRLVSSSVGGFLAAAPRFDLVVADPPRAGLGPIAAPLARAAGRLVLYVSCEPPTLARDLPAILAQGFVIESARLYDMFPLTHRLEALIALRRP